MTYPPLRTAPEPDDFDDLRKKLQPPAVGSRPDTTSWRPQEEGAGAEIAGRVTAVEEVDGNWGSKPVLTIETQDGNRKVWASHALLKSALEKHPPAPGSRILIRYEGSRTSAAGHEYHVYSVSTDRVLTVHPGRNWVDVFNSSGSAKPTIVRDDDLPF